MCLGRQSSMRACDNCFIAPALKGFSLDGSAVGLVFQKGCGPRGKYLGHTRDDVAMSEMGLTIQNGFKAPVMLYEVQAEEAPSATPSEVRCEWRNLLPLAWMRPGQVCRCLRLSTSGSLYADVFLIKNHPDGKKRSWKTALINKLFDRAGMQSVCPGSTGRGLRWDQMVYAPFKHKAVRLFRAACFVKPPFTSTEEPRMLNGDRDRDKGWSGLCGVASNGRVVALFRVQKSTI